MKEKKAGRQAEKKEGKQIPCNMYICLYMRRMWKDRPMLFTLVTTELEFAKGKGKALSSLGVGSWASEPMLQIDKWEAMIRLKGSRIT